LFAIFSPLPPLLFCLLALVGDEPTATVPYSKVNDAMVIKARINGKGPFSFVLDTGASKTVISPATLKKLGLKGSGKAVQLVGVAGKSMRAEMCMLGELAVGNAKARRLEVVVHPIEHLNREGIVGLLGQDFIDRFNMQFNIAYHTITLTLPSTDQPMAAVLSAHELRVKSVLEDPANLLDGAQSIYMKLQALASAYAPDNSAASQEEASALVMEIQQKLRNLEPVNAQLRNSSYPEMDGQEANNMQRFLFCYPGHARFLRAAVAMAEAYAVALPCHKCNDTLEISFARLGNCR